MAVFLILLIGKSNAQTTLPTYWDFATTPTTLPTGWSTNTTESYTSGLPDQGGGSRAGKLKATNDFFTVHFADEPSLVSYNLRAYSSNSAPFSGTFVVQESEDGFFWSTLATHTNNAFGNAWAPFNATPDPDSRYIRFFFANKISGVNVGLDDVTIQESIPVNEEINVVYNGANQPNGSSIQFAAAVGNPITLKLGIQNLGSAGTLLINGANFTGSAAGDYSVVNLPQSVAPQSSDTLIISFSPASNGNRLATLNIDNSDSNEDPYVINLQGIGGTSASEPASNPSNLTIPVNKSYRVRVDFNDVGSDGYLVLLAKNRNIQATIADNQVYEKGQGIGNAKVAYIGSANSIWLKEATGDDTLYLRVFAFNGTGNFINYRTSDPLDTSVITPRANYRLPNYYNSIDINAQNFVSDLSDVINPHIVFSYDNYAPNMIEPLTARDTINNQQVVTCVYSDDEVIFTPPFAWQGTNMNREHTLPSSWMPTSGSTNTPEYQDYHHLFPTISTANSQRSNEPLGEVVTVSSSYGAGKRGTDAFGNTVYEPRDAQKGDAARAIMYMLTAYHNQSGNSWALEDLLTQGPDQRLDVLIKWHIEDLPSGFEFARNDYLDSLQQNRNPFVDSAHWACYINFRNMTYIANPDSNCLAATLPKSITPIDTSGGNDTTSAVGDEMDKDQWLIYPNPSSGTVWIGHESETPFWVRISTLDGKLMKSIELQQLSEIDLSGWSKGVYLINVGEGENQNLPSKTTRFILQ
jgi:hypothetical protein